MAKTLLELDFLGAITASRSGGRHRFEERGRHRHFEERVLTVDQRRTIAHLLPESARGLTPVG
ncbi:MAG TPA: hypothetical protein VK095_03270 [Beutenbergiaceae bacterium]|nr:hypothetical protein [Beutenbergiaceae bacterium]